MYVEVEVSRKMKKRLHTGISFQKKLANVHNNSVLGYLIVHPRKRFLTSSQSGRTIFAAPCGHVTSVNPACRKLNHAASGCVPEPLVSVRQPSLLPFPRGPSTQKRAALFAHIVAEVAAVVAALRMSTIDLGGFGTGQTQRCAVNRYRKPRFIATVL